MNDDDNTNKIDPSGNASDMISDPTGMTGITSNSQGHSTNPSTGLIEESYSDQKLAEADDKASEGDTGFSADSDLSEEESLNEASGNDTLIDAPPSVQGEQSVSGDMPDPSSDDDTLANAQAMGFQLNETTEHPEEIDIARDIDKAEENI